MFEGYLNQIHTELSRRLSDVKELSLLPQLEKSLGGGGIPWIEQMCPLLRLRALFQNQ